MTVGEILAKWGNILTWWGNIVIHQKYYVKWGTVPLDLMGTYPQVVGKYFYIWGKYSSFVGKYLDTIRKTLALGEPVMTWRGKEPGLMGSYPKLGTSVMVCWGTLPGWQDGNPLQPVRRGNILYW